MTFCFPLNWDSVTGGPLRASSRKSGASIPTATRLVSVGGSLVGSLGPRDAP